MTDTPPPAAGSIQDLLDQIPHHMLTIDQRHGLANALCEAFNRGMAYVRTVPQSPVPPAHLIDDAQRAHRDLGYALDRLAAAQEQAAARQVREDGIRDGLIEWRDDLEAENGRLRAALAFAASVIKSGEPWTTTCEQVIGGALRSGSD